MSNEEYARDEDATLGHHRQTRLRVGGWLPAHQAPAEWRASRPTHSWRGSAHGRLAEEPDAVSPASGPSRRLMLLAGVAALVAAVSAGVALVLDRPEPGGRIASPSVTVGGTPTIQALPIAPGLPAPGSATPSATAATDSGSAARSNPARAGGHRSAPRNSPTAASPSPSARKTGDGTVALTVNTTVGLEPLDRGGYRVRHFQFRARIDEISASSSALDRADSRFIVRAGLAKSSCVSFESVNYPGRFLRHQNFAVFLHVRERGALFAADTTFCPVNGLAGQFTSLRSYNYPSRYLSVRDSLLFLDPASGANRTAMTFAVRPPR